ncbi:MAG: ABC transporter ATP-binding protein [Thomasclavelia sp.]|nr:ABC transporter ATP-binding protein [Thomasclavelia sp.]
MKNNKKKINWKVLGRLFKYVLTNYKFSCFVVLICIIIGAIATTSATVFVKSLIDNYITPMLSQNTPDFQPLIMALMQMACIYLVGVICTYAYNRILINISQGTLKRVRDDLFEHMEKLPIKYFDTHSHGDIMSVYTNDTDTLRQVISQSIPQVISMFCSIVAVFCSMVVLDIPLTILALVFMFFMLKATNYISGNSGKYFAMQQDRLGKENGYIEELMEGSRVVKVFTREKEVNEDFNKINEELFEASYQANKYSNILMPIVANLGNISYVCTALIGGLLAISGVSGSITIGTLSSFVLLNKSFNQPISQISMQINSVIMAMAGAERIFTLMDEEVEIDEGKITLVNVTYGANNQAVEKDFNTGHWAWKHVHEDGSVDYVPLLGEVKFNDVTFGYSDDKMVLHDINLYANPGHKLAFVGATGAGKTTMTNLINRFYDVQEGSITYDGIDVKLIKKDDLRRSLGIVLQDTHLFTGTIMENIRYSKPDASDEEVIKAAKLANAHGFIKHLEHGYDTILHNDGSNLSQGQRQLLSIARAAIANPPVLILDEATSSIDSRTEKIVQEGMDKLMDGRTSFVIAHRLSTIKNSNAIMVMDHGRIIERGNHQDLLKSKGVYYQLYTGKIEMD